MGSRRTAPPGGGAAPIVAAETGDTHPSAQRGEPAPLLLGLRSRLESRREVAAIAPGPLQATGTRRQPNPAARTTPKRPIGHATALLSWMISMPSLNLTPSITLPSWRKPRNRRQDSSALMPIL